ncbi:MAG TPA: hypothetical protein VLU43_11990 [Anaeromyxobacteraceae bacterium]|nr:hypothetical protein [Anaeromyxobacteraceae bacterium]
MTSTSRARLLLAMVAVAATAPARAIPAFARKYGTSCLTCHTVYPKLTPFGEAVRRNGYRFPGVDGDYVKQETVALGQEASKKTFPDSVWPASIPISVPIAIGFNGQAAVYPDKNASFPRTNDGTQATLDGLVSEGHIWGGAALDDKVTLWAELTFADGGAELEHAQVLLNDLVGPKHALNLVLGRGFLTLTSFGMHSSYLGDAAITAAPVTGIYGLSEDPFLLGDNYDGVEVNGVLGGRADWSAGVTAGKNAFSGGIKFNSENVYGHLGFKLGGMRLDGEGSQGPADPTRPWAESAATLDLFAVHSREYFDDPGGSGEPVGDTSLSLGGALRAQLGSAELNLIAYSQQHDRGTPTLGKVTADVESAELSYVLFPWLVPAVRVERIGLRPSGGASVSDLHVMPGIAFLLRANVKAVLVANLEWANGFPSDAGGAPLPWQGGNADWGNFVAVPKAGSTPTSKLNEFESIALFLAWAM